MSDSSTEISKKNIGRAFWLASYPKSGNTWVRMFLGAYRFGALNINNGSTYTEYDHNQYYYNSLSPWPSRELNPEAFLLLRSAMLCHLIMNSRISPIIIKTHCFNGDMEDIPLIPSLLTNSAVYIIRDPRDVVLSFARHLDKTVNVTITLMNTPGFALSKGDYGVASYLNSWSGHVKSWSQEGVTIVRYEDMKSNPEFIFEKILEGFDMKVDKERMLKAIKECELSKLMKQEDAKGFKEIGKSEKFFGQGKGWQNELTEKQVKRIEQDHGEVMEAMGYKLEY